LPQLGIRIAEEIAKTRARVAVISFGNPYLLAAIPQISTYIAGYSPYPVSQRAAARAVLGEMDITGKLPVTLPGLYLRGHGIQVQRMLR
jgi:beta-N-acetylhexosaminidase